MVSPSGRHDALEPEERIAALDILRGLALFGVLAVNLVAEFRVSIFQQFLQIDTAGLADSVVEAFVRVALEFKAFALFSFLFGAGLAIQFERLSSGTMPLYWLVRRLVVLLAFGLVHLLFIWNGDILTEYAIGGLLVLPLLAAPVWVLATGSACLFAVYLVFAVLPPFAVIPDATWIQHHVAEANRVYATGGFAEIHDFSMREVPYLIPLHIAVLPRTLSFFLLGALAWRTRIFRRPLDHRPLLVRAAWLGILGGSALTLVEATGALSAWIGRSSIQEVLHRIADVLLALGYGSTVIALVEFASVRRVLDWFAPLGRMAFTNYVLQSLVFGWIFFGYGLGLFAHLGATTALALGIGVYAIQCVLSAWSLRRYRFGPLEWLWRTLMYGKAQAMTVMRPA